MIRFGMLTVLPWILWTAALAASPDKGSATEVLETPDQVIASVLRQSIGAPARADLDDQATVRLSEDLIIIPRDPAVRLLTVSNRPVPPDFTALVVGSEGFDAPGLIRFVPAGFIDTDAAIGLTADDMLFSLNETEKRKNAERVAQNQPLQEVRGWVRPPRYDAKTHQLSWAALTLPQNAPAESDGEVTYHAVGFGREGYVDLTVVNGVQKAAEIGHMIDLFLLGLSFQPGKAYGDALPTEHLVPNGLAMVMGVDALHKAMTVRDFWASDEVIPVAGGIVATVGALSSFVGVRRHLRRRSRRI